MASETPILANVVITEVIAVGHYYRGDLPNGKSINVHAPKGGLDGGTYAPGDTVSVEMTPYDFNKGRIRPSKVSH